MTPVSFRSCCDELLSFTSQKSELFCARPRSYYALSWRVYARHGEGRHKKDLQTDETSNLSQLRKGAILASFLSTNP